MKNRKKSLRALTVIFAVFMLTALVAAGGCQKEDDESATATAAPSLTAAKTTAKPVATSATKTTAAAVVSSTTVAAAEATPTQEEPAEITEEVSEEYEEVFEEQDFSDVEVEIKHKIIEQPIDLGGMTVIFTASKTNLPQSDAAAFAPDNVIAYRRIEEAEKKYNFKIEYIDEASNATAYNNKLMTNTLAGLRITDVFMTSSNYTFPLLVYNKAILPLDDYIDYEMPIIKVNKMISEGSYYFGKHYGTGFKYYLLGYLMHYNRDIISKEGLTDILDLVENKTWNWSALLEYAQRTTKDYDGDGIVDQWGLTISGQVTLMYGILRSNGQTGADFSTGKALFALDSPKSMKCLQFMSDLLHVHKVVLFNNVTAYRKGTVAMDIESGAGGNITTLKGGVNSVQIPLPMGPDVTDYTNMGSAQFHSISSLCPKPEEITKIWTETCIIWDENLNMAPDLQKLSDEKYPYDFRWSPSNASRYNSSERERRIIESLFAKVSVDFTAGYPSWSNTNAYMTNNVIKPLTDGTKSVNQAIEAVRYELQAILDEYNP